MVEIHFHTRIALDRNKRHASPSISSLGSMDFSPNIATRKSAFQRQSMVQRPLEFQNLPGEKKHGVIFLLMKKILVSSWHTVYCTCKISKTDSWFFIIPTWVYSERVRLFQCDQLPSSSLLWYRWLVQVVTRVGWDAPAGYFTGFCCWKLD